MTDRRCGTCDAKHLPDVPDAEFVCPECGAKAGEWHISVAHDDDCDRMTVDDWCVCSMCRHTETAGTWVRRWRKTRSLVTCPHCKGAGVVKS